MVSPIPSHPYHSAFSPAQGEHWVDSLEGSNSCPDPEAPGGAVGEEGPGASGTPIHGSTGADLITLAQETISIRFTAMRPFLPQLLVPGSVSFVLLERQILQQVRWPFPPFLGSGTLTMPPSKAGLPAWRQHPATALWGKAGAEGSMPWGRGFSEGGGDSVRMGTRPGFVSRHPYPGRCV